jgi:hypothetical protein
MSGAYGVVAEFASPEQVLEAAREASRGAYRVMDAFTPYPVEGLAEEIGFPRSRLPVFTLLGGIFGGGGAYFMLWYSSVISYPLNVGGRPLHSWPAFLPITFEMTVLFAALATVAGLLILNRLPRLHHPIFNTPYYAERSGRHFYLCIRSTNPGYDPSAIAALMRRFRPEQVQEIAA